MVFQNFSYYNFALLFLAYNWNWLLLLISLAPAAQCVPTTRNIIGFDSPNPNFIAGFCKYLSDGFYEYPYDCAAYISCIDSKSELEYCSGDKLFNKALQICDTPDSVDCNELEKPIPDPKCLNAPSGTIFPSIEHCDEFIVCIDQQAVMQKCPDQYLFNPLILICDDPNEVVCYTDQTTTQLTTTQAPSTTTEAYTKCVGQEFGTTFPYIEDCQQYILCLGDDEYYKAKCPINSWYDPKTGECGTNVSPTACQEVETTTTAASTTQSPQDRCANQEIGISYPLVTDCKKYIICLGNGESAIVDCIYNSWYDPATGNCEQNVSPTACQESAITTTTTTAATTATTTTQKPPATTVQPDVEICAGVSSGQYVNYPDNCSKYIICIEPVPIAFHCTKGYFFSAARQQCVDWAQSDCDSSGTTVLPPAAPPPTPAPDTCLNGKGNTLPFTANCQWFIRCINDNVYMMGVCSIGEYYDPVSGSCGGNVSPDACLQRYTTTVSTTIEIEKTSTTTTTTTSQPDPADPCAGIEEGVLVPYPNDCTKFIQCNSPDPLVFNCAQGQEFSPTLKRCMAAWYANCTMTAPTVTPWTSTTKLPNPTPNDICEGKTDGSLIPYPHNCSKYIVCQDPIAVGYDCPDQQEFNSIIMSCTDKQLANCTT